MNKLNIARTQIDKIDKQLAELFEQRMDVLKDVVDYKIQNKLPVLDEGREQQVIIKNLKFIKNNEYMPYYKDFISYILKSSKQYQQRLINTDIIGYQGTAGAFAHIAVGNIYKDHKTKAYPTWEEVFNAVENGDVAFGVVPFENSYTGEVGEVLDLLYKHNCKIVKIYDLKITQNLVGIKGAKLSDIKQVYSHHQALSQSKRFLDAHSFELTPYLNTATAAQFVSEQKDKSKAAVASIETAKLYNLDIIVEDINTSAENTTRFIVLSKNQNDDGNRFNMMFTLNHSAGELANVMQIISKYGFSMESIKSKPIKNLPWQYYFYVEIIGRFKDQTSTKLINDLKKACKEFKLLGIYSKE